jgi:hypothetical protein
MSAENAPGDRSTLKSTGFPSQIASCSIRPLSDQT